MEAPLKIPKMGKESRTRIEARMRMGGDKKLKALLDDSEEEEYEHNDLNDSFEYKMQNFGIKRVKVDK